MSLYIIKRRPLNGAYKLSNFINEKVKRTECNYMIVINW
jgi:hypothetical protein